MFMDRRIQWVDLAGYLRSLGDAGIESPCIYAGEALDGTSAEEIPPFIVKSHTFLEALAIPNSTPH